MKGKGVLIFDIVSLVILGAAILAFILTGLPH